MRSRRRRSARELFEAAARGDWEAFQEFQRLIRRLVRHRLGHDDESAIEDACDRVRDKLERLRERGFSGGDAEFFVYVCRVVASQVVVVWHLRSREVSLDEPADSDGEDPTPRRDLVMAMIEPHWDTLRDLSDRSEGRPLREAFAQLDDRCRRLLLEREVEHRSESEIAAMLGITTNNVAVSLHRCKDRLLRIALKILCAGADRDWRTQISCLIDKLLEPRATVIRLWWEKDLRPRAIARHLDRDEREVQDLFVRAKAALWRLAQEQAEP